MTPKALRALKASISHWNRMATGRRKGNEKPQADECALCREFLETASCNGCPVREHTVLRYCYGTPYLDAKTQWGMYGISSPEFKEAAREEWLFLKSLLPRSVKQTTTKTKKGKS